MQPQEIKARCRNIGLEQRDLARLAGLHKTTIERTLNEKTVPLTTTQDRIVAALEGAERAKRDALIALHGRPVAEAVA